MKRLLMLVLLAAAELASPAAAQEIPSCLEFADKQTAPGASPDCAPINITNAEAFNVLQEFKVQKSGYDYFIARRTDEWESLSSSAIWQLLALVVSAIQSLYNENSDVYFIADVGRAPMFLDEVPQDQIVARAIYPSPSLLLNPTEVYPPGHHERMYTLIVYR